MNGRFALNPAKAKVMGVCAGIADYFNVDVLLVRLAMVGITLITGPVAILLYILTGWLATEDR
ncbi:PspC domain-containing protein [Sphingomonas jaspsi]|jgi:phage shock protein C|uniref:PspC domain-containing protein n=1 Tax=Sphingomonas jaspsi TaxID=392409 RepID=UPI0004B32609|nr:PspC domain-containing protein [Sphingomonas jaspsi]